MRWWYWLILGVWAFTGLPMLVLGIGFAGLEVFTLRGLITLFTPPLSYPEELPWWIGGWLWTAAPLWTAPFAIRRRKRDQISN